MDAAAAGPEEIQHRRKKHDPPGRNEDLRRAPDPFPCQRRENQGQGQEEARIEEGEVVEDHERRPDSRGYETGCPCGPERAFEDVPEENEAEEREDEPGRVDVRPLDGLYAGSQPVHDGNEGTSPARKRQERNGRLFAHP